MVRGKGLVHKQTDMGTQIRQGLINVNKVQELPFLEKERKKR